MIINPLGTINSVQSLNMINSREWSSSNERWRLGRKVQWRTRWSGRWRNDRRLLWRLAADSGIHRLQSRNRCTGNIWNWLIAFIEKSQSLFVPSMWSWNHNHNHISSLRSERKNFHGKWQQSLNCFAVPKSPISLRDLAQVTVVVFVWAQKSRFAEKLARLASNIASKGLMILSKLRAINRYWPRAEDERVELKNFFIIFLLPFCFLIVLLNSRWFFF